MVLSSKTTYFIKRLLLIPVTLFGIMILNFMFVQLAPGGPVEQMMLKMEQLLLLKLMGLLLIKKCISGTTILNYNL